jgi:hypothetical protein
VSSATGRIGAATKQGTAVQDGDATVDDQALASVDDQALAAMVAEYGDRVANLPPVVIVIAAYNEEGPIGGVVKALPATVCGLATVALVVVDGSSDGTAQAAREAGALVCDVPVNRGQGAALRLGYRAARQGGAKYIVTTDADGQYNPDEIEPLLRPILAGEADFVTGSRKLGSQETKDPIRRLGVRFFAASISALTGQRITDTTFGLRVMRAEVTAAVLLDQPQYQASELLIGAISRGFRVAERPATIHRRTIGQSKKGHNFFYGLRFAGVVLRTWWRERQRPGDADNERSPAASGDQRQPGRPEKTSSSSGLAADGSGDGAAAGGAEDGRAAAAASGTSAAPADPAVSTDSSDSADPMDSAAAGPAAERRSAKRK